jgi:hypothetical protein
MPPCSAALQFLMDVGPGNAPFAKPALSMAGFDGWKLL